MTEKMFDMNLNSIYGINTHYITCYTKNNNTKNTIYVENNIRKYMLKYHYVLICNLHNYHTRCSTEYLLFLLFIFKNGCCNNCFVLYLFFGSLI
eukprot:138434_1